MNVNGVFYGFDNQMTSKRTLCACVFVFVFVFAVYVYITYKANVDSVLSSKLN